MRARARINKDPVVMKAVNFIVNVVNVGGKARQDESLNVLFK